MFPHFLAFESILTESHQESPLLDWVGKLDPVERSDNPANRRGIVTFGMIKSRQRCPGLRERMRATIVEEKLCQKLEPGSRRLGGRPTAQTFIDLC